MGFKKFNFNFRNNFSEKEFSLVTASLIKTINSC